MTDPYIMAKVRLQWKPPASVSQLSESEQSAVQYKTSWDVLSKVFKTEGFSGLYSGLTAQILKAVLCQAILFVSKEQLTEYTKAFFVALGVIETPSIKKVAR